jgi:hypothetical protein
MAETNTIVAPTEQAQGQQLDRADAQSQHNQAVKAGCAKLVNGFKSGADFRKDQLARRLVQEFAKSSVPKNITDRNEMDVYNEVVDSIGTDENARRIADEYADALYNALTAVRLTNDSGVTLKGGVNAQQFGMAYISWNPGRKLRDQTMLAAI